MKHDCPSLGCSGQFETTEELREHLYVAHGIGKLEADDLIKYL